MMRKILGIMLPLALAGVLLLTGCVYFPCSGEEGSGVLATEEREVGSFTRIALAGSPDVEVTVGEPPSVAVEADDNLIGMLSTRVRGDTLVIKIDGSCSSSLGFRVRVTVPALEAVEVTGSGDITVEGVQAERFTASVTGSGDAEVVGSTDRLVARVTGSGDLHLYDLASREAKASVTGSGDIEIRASGSLKASVTGSGDIAYAGSPPQVSRHVTGSGDITAR